MVGHSVFFFLKETAEVIQGVIAYVILKFFSMCSNEVVVMFECGPLSQLCECLLV